MPAQTQIQTQYISIHVEDGDLYKAGIYGHQYQPHCSSPFPDGLPTGDKNRVTAAAVTSNLPYQITPSSMGRLQVGAQAPNFEILLHALLLARGCDLKSTLTVYDWPKLSTLAWCVDWLLGLANHNQPASKHMNEIRTWQVARTWGDGPGRINSIKLVWPTSITICLEIIARISIGSLNPFMVATKTKLGPSHTLMSEHSHLSN